MIKFLWIFVILTFFPAFGFSQISKPISYQVHSFGEKGSIKMLYDRRQRPQSVFLDNKVHIVYNGNSEPGNSDKWRSKPVIITYDTKSREFSNEVTLGPAKSDHHFCPVIWADTNRKLHVLYGCHKTPGTHLISNKPSEIGSELKDWTIAPEIVSSISYPTFYRISANKELMYYRTAGHISSWSYLISEDNGKNWKGPEKEVTDLDSKGRFEWSSYQTKLPSADGRFLHVVFTAYDDNRTNDPKRYYNSRYKKAVSNEWKYNLYYIKVDVESGQVTNFNGANMDCPIDLDQANEKCMIWDTDGRGAGVPPEIVLDKNDNPAFLHVLSEEDTETHNYYFVQNVNGEWIKSLVAPSNHQWNSCHVQKDKKGNYHAFIVAGEEYLTTKWIEGHHEAEKIKNTDANRLYKGGFMDKHGGGRVEEWISGDGKSWQFVQDLTPDSSKYPGWKFNNIQPITKPDGSVVEGMLMFYGWKEKDDATAKVFLLHQN